MRRRLDHGAVVSTAEWPVLTHRSPNAIPAVIALSGALNVNVAATGPATLRIDSGRTAEVPWFVECYRQGIAARIDARRKAGLPVPDSVNLTPEVDVDAD